MTTLAIVAAVYIAALPLGYIIERFDWSADVNFRSFDPFGFFG